MSYVVPSVLVYQQLANSGGVANVTPDLDAVVMGPCYNVLEYDGTSATALTTTAALDDVGAAFSIVTNTINNVVNLPGQKPGQDVEGGSVEVYVNNAVVETLHTKFTAVASNTEITMAAVTATGNVTSGNKVVSGVTGASDLSVGDPVTVTGAGVAGGNLVTTVEAMTSNTITLTDTPGTSSASASITKGTISNINSLTSTRRVEPGDDVVITYTSGGSPAVFTSTVVEVVSLVGVITSVTLADLVPAAAAGTVQVSIRKKYNNQLVLKTLGGYANYDDSTVVVDGKITIKPQPRLSYGTIITGEVHVAYRALRKDLSGSIIDVEGPEDLAGKLGGATDRNPLALGVQLALANTTGRILAVAVPSNDLAGFLTGLDLIEGRRVYSVAPLTQDEAIITAVQQHVQQMSTPENASWRMTAVNSAIPTTQAIGTWNADNVNANGGNNTITLVNGRYILTASNATFMSDGVVPGDVIHVTAGAGTPSPVGTLKVLNVLNNQQIQVNATGTATGVSYYVTRVLTKAQQAAAVAGLCRTLGSNRVVYVPQGAGVTINGVTKYLPGYYLCCAIVGLISGLPAQQSLTNVGLAGIADVQYGNFYFTRAQLSTMAAAGACLIVQETQGSIPYVRHSLTTDMTTLEYREIQQVKNWDYLSYFFHDIIRGFIGRYNITSDSLRTLGQTITSGGRLLQGKKLPKIGAPLIDFRIKTLKQDENNKDGVIAEVPVKMPTVMNYVNLYLIA